MVFVNRNGGGGRNRTATHLIHSGKSIGSVTLTAIPFSWAMLTYSRIFFFANLGTTHLGPTKDEKDTLAIGERAGVNVWFSSLSGAS